MPEQPPSAAGYPPRLLDHHLDVLRRGDDGTLLAAALHLRSVDARALFAHAATGGAASVAELVANARSAATLASGPAVSRLDVSGLGELAQVLALQDLLPDDTADALALMDHALTAFGPNAVPPQHQGFHVQLAYHLGRHERTAELLSVYPEVPSQIRANVRLDLANPFHARGGDVAGWFARFGALLPPCRAELLDVAVTKRAGAAFDRLAATAVQAVSAPQRVTTIVTTFRPGEALGTAVRSLIAQSWANHEILVVDDGSPASYDCVLQRCVESDPRVRLLKLPANGGTYVARNAGLDVATGDFVTFQDSDDWSHPQRLEHQIRPLLADPALFGTTSVGMRVHDDLIVTRPGLADHRSYNLSSLMFRREVALRQLGYLDEVRKGADAEYVERARAVFGRPSVRHLGGRPYALIRLSPRSLSGGDIRVGWMHPARHAYLSAFQAWHRRVADGLADARRPKGSTDRPFAAPRHLSGADAGTPHYDVVLADDWTIAHSGALSQIRALTRRGLRVALLHLDALHRLTATSRNLDEAVQNLINDGSVDQVVISDGVDAKLVVVRSPPLLMFAPSVASGIRSARVVIAADEPPNDGRRPRYVPRLCAEAAQRLFGVKPLWCPQNSMIRERLDADRARPKLARIDLPATVDVDMWGLDRRAVPSDRPVLGRRLGGGAGSASRASRRAMREVLPLGTDVDVRLWVGSAGGQPDMRAFPRSWLVFDGAEVSVRSFLFQLDFYAHFPATSWGVPVSVLEAMAAGCVVVLPTRYADTFGDAAVYCEPPALARVVREYHTAPEEVRQLSLRARLYVRRHHASDVYAERVADLIPRTAIPRQ